MKLLILPLLFGLTGAHLLLPLDPLTLDPDLTRLLVIELRLPRTLLVIGYGGVLGISGAALQALFANPLASPDISGASSGAALGAVLGGYWPASLSRSRREPRPAWRSPSPPPRSLSTTPSTG